MNDASAYLILIVEDERELADIFRGFFEREGFRVALARDGSTAIDLHHSLKPDLVVLDVRLPKRDGFEVLAELRRAGSTPVIMSTALGEDLEKLTALKVGADDYLVKPFNPLELVARAKAVLRRSGGAAGNASVLRIGPIEIDLSAHQVRRVVAASAPAAIEMTRTEFRILAHMARTPRKAFTRSEIVDACLPGDGEALDRTVDSHVGNLRAKLAAAGETGWLQGVRGIGYRLMSP